MSALAKRAHKRLDLLKAATKALARADRLAVQWRREAAQMYEASSHAVLLRHCADQLEKAIKP